jgi:glucosylceramidase
MGPRLHFRPSDPRALAVRDSTSAELPVYTSRELAMYIRRQGNSRASWVWVIAACSVACGAERSMAGREPLPPSSAAGVEKWPGTRQVSAPEVASEPELITSGPGNYWQAGALAEVAGRVPDLRVDEQSRLQEWLGFGGTFNEAGWDALLVVDASERVRAMQLLFDDRDGARFSYGRIPIGASDFALDRYTLAEEANDYALASFSIERDRRLLIPYVKAALAVEPGLNLWASPWTPPAWMKENNSTDGGRIRDEPSVLDAYARYLARFVEAYAAEGMAIRALHPQNEPGYEQTYPTCLWTPELLRDFIGHHLGPTLNEHGVAAEIWLGTMSAPGDTQHVVATMADADAARYIHGIGLQWNTRDAVSGFASSYGLPIMQTEHRCGNYPWAKAKFNALEAPNDHAYAEQSWRDISEWVRAGVNAYSAWNMVLDRVGRNMDEKRPWPQNALLVVDRAARTLRATPAYYVFRHLSQFIDPGARRLVTDGEVDSLAFANPDGGIVAVLYNARDTPREVTLGVRTSLIALTVPAHGWATVNWSAGTRGQ